MTAEMRRSRADTGGSKPLGKKFKMLKELARLNQELRVQRPLSPKDQKMLQEQENWSGAVRGQQFLKRGLGTGGGHIPGVEIQKGRLNTDNIQRASIKELIMQHT